MLNSNDARENYQFYDASESEDKIIRSVIRSIESPKKNMMINIGLFVMATIVALLLIKSQIDSGNPNVTLIIVSLALPVVFGYTIYTEYKKRTASSGIEMTKDKNQHYLILKGKCIEKSYEEKKRIYSISARSVTNRTIDKILVSRGVYNYLTPNEGIYIVLPDLPDNHDMVGIPSQYMQDFKSKEEEREHVETTKREPKPEELEWMIPQYKEKASLRSALYNRNNIICLIISLGISALGFFKGKAGPTYLGAVAAVLFLGTILSPYSEDRKLYKQIADKNVPKMVLDAYVSKVDTKNQEVSFSMYGAKEPVYVSKKAWINKDYVLNSPALLLYIKEEQPIPFKKP